MERKEIQEAYSKLKGIRAYVRRNRLLFYNRGDRIHQKQMAFHRDRHRNRWMFGGNRTGKTVSGAVEAVWYARGNHPYKEIPHPTKGWVVSLTGEVQRDVAQQEILRWLNPDWIKQIVTRKGKAEHPENATIDFIVVAHERGGESLISFKSCDQGREKFQGASLDYVWFDEEPPREVYEECRMRVLDTRGDLWGTMTPLKGLTWVYDLIYVNERNDPEVKCWFMNWEDNPYLSGEEIRALESTLSKEELEARKYGRFVAINGLVYKEFDETVHVIEPFEIPEEWQDRISIDPGYTHPLSCHFYACDGDGNVYVAGEHYAAEQNVEQHAEEIFAVADRLGWKRSETGYLEALIDSAATQRTAASERSVVDLFLDHGILCNPRVNKSKFAGIQRVKEYLHPREGLDGTKKPKLFVFSDCVNMIREFKTYRWAKDGREEPQKENDHAMDELRYYIMAKPQSHPKEVVPTYHFGIERPQEEGLDALFGGELTRSFLEYNGLPEK